MSLASRSPAWTGISRPLDFHYRSNRFVAIAAGTAGLAAFAWQWSAGRDALALAPFSVAAGVFLAWAIGRELDPDDTSPAALAAVVVLPLMALGPPSLGSSAAMLMAVRIAVRTTGLSPQWIDGVGLVVAAAYLGTQSQTWPALAALVLAMALDPFIEPRGLGRTLWFSGAMATVALTGAIAYSAPSAWRQPTRTEWLVLGVTGAAALLAVANTRAPRSRCDSHDEPLSRPRLRAGRVLAGLTLAVGAVQLGGPAAHALGPLLAAVAGVGLAQVTRWLQGSAWWADAPR